MNLKPHTRSASHKSRGATHTHRQTLTHSHTHTLTHSRYAVTKAPTVTHQHHRRSPLQRRAGQVAAGRRTYRGRIASATSSLLRPATSFVFLETDARIIFYCVGSCSCVCARAAACTGRLGLRPGTVQALLHYFVAYAKTLSISRLVWSWPCFILQASMSKAAQKLQACMSPRSGRRKPCDD